MPAASTAAWWMIVRFPPPLVGRDETEAPRELKNFTVPEISHADKRAFCMREKADSPWATSHRIASKNPELSDSGS